MDHLEYLMEDQDTRESYMVENGYTKDLISDGGKKIDEREYVERDEVEGTNLPGVLALGSVVTGTLSVGLYSSEAAYIGMGDASGTTFATIFGVSSAGLALGAIGAYLEPEEDIGR